MTVLEYASDWNGLIHPLGLRGMVDGQVRSHVVSTVSQVDLEILVTENLLFIAENRVGELGLEGSDGLKPFLRRRDQNDIDSLVGIHHIFDRELAVVKPNFHQKLTGGILNLSHCDVCIAGPIALLCD